MPDDYYVSQYSGEEIDALLASAGVPIGITKEYQSVAEMNQDFTGTDVQRGQFVLILTTDTSSEDYGKVYLKGTANWVYVFTLTSLTAIKGPQGPAGKQGPAGPEGKAVSFTVTLTAAGWSGSAQTVSNSNFAASGYAYTVAPASGSFAAYASAVIYADDVTAAGEMTFHCGETPTEDLTVNILRMEAAV